MTTTPKWEIRDAWVSSFDILGFKNLANVKGDSFAAQLVRDDYERVLEHLASSADMRALGTVSYLWLSDTFVLFTTDDSSASYRLIQFAAKHFIEECLYSGVPIRGAISVGSIVTSDDNRSIMGEAFIDAFVTGEDQNWIGLLLSARAISRVRSLGLDPARHDFVSSPSIPMRKLKADDVMAYRFQNGAANYESPLLHTLASMKQGADSRNVGKYDRTCEFIKCHYSRIETD
jgi:hypothetical protein